MSNSKLKFDPHYFLPDDLTDCKIDLEEKRRRIIQVAANEDVKLENNAKDCISRFLARGEHHARPDEPVELLRVLINSCLSYSVINKQLKKILGDEPTNFTLPKALAAIFKDVELGNPNTWSIEWVLDKADRIQRMQNYDLKSRNLEPRITAVLLTAPIALKKEINNGLENFYSRIEQTCYSGPEAMWKLAKKFSIPILQVGPALACEFFKNIGFSRFVKMDFHLLREVPSLLKNAPRMFIYDCKNPTEKQKREMFILTQHLADRIGMSPFHLDQILYYWGRLKKSADIM